MEKEGKITTYIIVICNMYIKRQRRRRRRHCVVERIWRARAFPVRPEVCFLLAAAAVLIIIIICGSEFIFFFFIYTPSVVATTTGSARQEVSVVRAVYRSIFTTCACLKPSSSSSFVCLMIASSPCLHIIMRRTHYYGKEKSNK